VKVFIIAEAGVNHNGSIDNAYKLVDIAVQSGADAIKFQTFKADNIVTKESKKADYQKNNTNSSETQFEMLKKLELDKESHIKILNYCKANNIIFLSTPFDSESIEMLDSLGLEIFKIPSGEITNLPYLRQVGKLNQEVILSTGMSEMIEIIDAVRILVDSGTLRENITILHANSMYPTPMEDVNLNAMKMIGERLNIKYGYSDHTLGIEVDIAAVAMGASIIEKHFTIDKSMVGPDHKSSLDPSELSLMVSSIRNIEKAMGIPKKVVTKSESVNKKIVRKSIIAKKSIKKGEKFTNDNLTIKRPGTGISPMKWDVMLEKFAKKDYKKDQLI
jgi:N,N'-diacetyllegionaminate synthase